MGGANNTELQSFSVYCPKAFAGIGQLPDTLADRTIGVRLTRRTREEVIERFRRRDVEVEAEPLRLSCETLAEHHTDHLADARPEPPDELDDRAWDVWEPLFAIADLAGGDWPARARTAALALSTGEARDDDSLSAKIVRDIYGVFAANEWRQCKTSELIDELAKIEESPWGDWYGNTISAQQVSKLLKPYRIKTMAVWDEWKQATVRGYKAEQLAEPYRRVVGVRGVSGVRDETGRETAPNAPNAGDAAGGAAAGSCRNGPRRLRARSRAGGNRGAVPPVAGCGVVVPRRGAVVTLLSSLSPEAREELRLFVQAEVAAALAARDREPAKRWLTAAEAGAYLGISARAVYARVRRGRIPAGAVKHSGRSLLLDRLTSTVRLIANDRILLHKLASVSIWGRHCTYSQGGHQWPAVRSRPRRSRGSRPRT
jgi:hypothetical protein